MLLRRISRLVLPVSGGLLLGITLFWIAPEMARTNGVMITIGWTAAVASEFSGSAETGLLDRVFVHKVPEADSP
jgi:hypothetical protein